MADFIPRDLSHPFDPADPEQLAEFEGFACDVPTTGGMIDAVNNPLLATPANTVRAANMFAPGFLTGLVGGVNDLPTPDAILPSAGATFERRGLHDATLPVPGLAAGVPMWSFEARMNRSVPVNIGTWPASTIRVREGEIVHTVMNNRQGPHTIHHHGIEPTPANDGVGHLTFEVSGGNYTYQWKAAESGTYFYHCHRNTTLHFEMGMYGMLIVDPNVEGAPFADGGPGMCLVRDTPTAYHREAIWVADDIDSRWHNGLPVAVGIQACDTDGRSGFVLWGDPDNPRLNDFNPTYFVVSGQAAQAVDDGVNLIEGVRATATSGEKILVRALNASYCTTVWTFPTSLQGSVIARDGRTLGRSRFGSYSEPFTLASIGHQFTFTTAQRFDILVDTAGARLGEHLVTIEFRHWITNALLRTLRVPITINS